MRSPVNRRSLHVKDEGGLYDGPPVPRSSMPRTRSSRKLLANGSRASPRSSACTAFRYVLNPAACSFGSMQLIMLSIEITAPSRPNITLPALPGLRHVHGRRSMLLISTSKASSSPRSKQRRRPMAARPSSAFARKKKKNALRNVVAVGGSWIASADEMAKGDWDAMIEDVRDRQAGRPYLFDLGQERLADHLTRIQRLQTYERQHKIKLVSFLPGG